MTDRRLNTWLETSAVLPEAGRIGVFNAWPEIALTGIDPDRIHAVQPMADPNAILAQRGLNTAKVVNDSYDAVILRVPREKARALSYLKDAVRNTPDDAAIIIDGQKTDGIESLLKFCRKHFDVQEVYSKDHGKVFWFKKRGQERDVMTALALPEPTPKLQPMGFHTAPGVFSADAPDKASVFLTETLPELKGHVIDLGAGWGYLSHNILAQSQPTRLDLVEADWLALACARENVISDVAAFHWADARSFRPKALADHVVTNPPFHTGRTADPSLGQAFIRAAAAMLKPNGTLWLVANRHLPYEKTLEASFRDVQTLGETAQFKLYAASKPRSPRKG